MGPVRQAGHLAKAARTVLEGGVIEARAIEGIKSLHANLQLLGLANPELLPEAEIHILDSLRGQIAEVSRRIAQLLVARIGEAIGVEHRDTTSRPIQKGGGGRVRADSRARVRT